MYCRPLAIVPALAVTSLASVGFAEPSERECKDAAAAFAEMLNPKETTASGGIGWVLLPPAVDFYSLDEADQWREVASRLENYAVILVTGTDFQPPFTRNAKWTDEIKPDERRDYAKGFMELDTLEQCIRPIATARSTDIKTEIDTLDSRFPPDTRASLRPLMKASQ